MNKQLIEFWKKDSITIAKYYWDKLQKDGFSKKALGEREGTDDYDFYDSLFQDIDFPKNVSVLDVGLGIGEVIPYLRNRKGVNISRYYGIDLIKDLVEYSKSKYNQEGFEFKQENFINEDFSLKEKFDLVIGAGVLFLRTREYNTYLEYFIEKMISHSKGFVFFNIITDVDKSSKNYSGRLEVGRISFIPKLYLVGILDKIKQRKKFSYVINEKNIYEDATDAFVQIKID